MRKILLTILTLTLILVSLNTMVFAANETVYFGDGSATITASSDTVVVPVYVSPNAEMIQYAEYGIGVLEIKYSVTNATESATATGLTNLSGNCGAGSISYSMPSTLTFTNYTDSTPFIVANITITRSGEATNSVLTISSVMICDATLPYNDVTKQSAVTINWPSDEEEFDDSFEGFVNDNGDVVETGFEKGNVATVFAKATENLAAESYGIWFGGCKYVGKLPVDNGEYWVIKLYDPNGVLDSNEDYACKIFVGNSIINEDADCTINPVN